jgi:hypothetical protein
MMDDFDPLAALRADPQMARILPEQDREFADPLQRWRNQQEQFVRDCTAEARARRHGGEENAPVKIDERVRAYFTPVLKAVATLMRREIDTAIEQAKADMRLEVRYLIHRSRRSRRSRGAKRRVPRMLAEAEAYVMAQPTFEQLHGGSRLERRARDDGAGQQTVSEPAKADAPAQPAAQSQPPAPAEQLADGRVVMRPDGSFGVYRIPGRRSP